MKVPIPLASRTSHSRTLADSSSEALALNVDKTVTEATPLFESSLYLGTDNAVRKRFQANISRLLSHFSQGRIYTYQFDILRAVRSRGG